MSTRTVEKKDIFDNVPYLASQHYDHKKDPSEFKGTIGNWMIDEQVMEVTNGIYSIIVSNTDGKTIGHIFGSTKEELLANAKVIAMAPNMHKALKVASLKFIEIDCSPRKYWQKSARYINNRINELIYSVTN